METFLIGLLGSLTASLVILAFGYIISRTLRVRFVRFFLRAFGAGIEFVYKDQSTAETDITSALKKSKNIKLIQFRGHSLTEGYLSFLLTEKPDRETKVLLANPDVDGKNNPVVQRAEELSRHTESQMKPEPYKEEVRSSIKSLYRRKQKRNPKLELRLYDFPAVFRLIIIGDKELFLSFYPSNKRGKKNSIFRIPSSSPMFEMMNRYFDFVWAGPRSVEPPRSYKLPPPNVNLSLVPKLLILSGPSGAGKTTLLREINHPDLSHHVKATTRTPRRHEIQGEDFHFMDRETFRSSSFLYDYERLGARYGIYTNQIEEASRDDKFHVITVMDLEIVEELKLRYPDSKAVCVLADVSTIEERLTERIQHSYDRREKLLLENCSQTYEQFKSQEGLFDEHINNSDTVEQGVIELRRIVDSMLA